MANEAGYLYGLAGLQAGLGILKGISQEEAYKLEAEQAGLEAKSAELSRRQDLQDALAMQAVITGASGRTGGEGSVQQIVQADKKKAQREIGMLKAGAKAKRAALTGAGKMAKVSSITGGLLSAAQTAYQTKKVK